MNASWGMCMNYINEEERHRRVFRSKRIAYGEGQRYRLSMVGDRLQMQESTEMSPINLLRGLDSPDKMSFFFPLDLKKISVFKSHFTNLCCSTTEDNWIKHLEMHFWSGSSLTQHRHWLRVIPSPFLVLT